VKRERIRTLLLPNWGHQYGSALQQALAEADVVTLACDAGWGFSLHEKIDMVLALRPDVLHLQWPEALCEVREGDDLAAIAERMRTALARVRDARIPVVWTMHNLEPHRLKFPFYTELYGLFASHASGVIHHSESGRRRAVSAYSYAGSAKHAVIRHGYFDPGPECPLSRSEARASLGISAEASVYLFCGAFRRDKNLDVLVWAFAGEDPGSRILLMAGDDRKAAAALHPGLSLDAPNIRWPGHLSRTDLAVHVRAADAFVCVHGDEHLTSAGPHLCQSYGMTQICLESEYTREVLGGNAFYFTREGDIVANLRERLASVSPGELRSASERIIATRNEYRWERIGRQTSALYEEILDD